MIQIELGEGKYIIRARKTEDGGGISIYHAAEQYEVGQSKDIAVVGDPVIVITGAAAGLEVLAEQAAKAARRAARAESEVA